MEQNRVEVAVSRWDAKQAKYLQKFGTDLLQDREFNLLRLQVWKRIVKQHNKLRLTEGEYDDLHFVKGQIRQMDDALFPGIKGFFQKMNYKFWKTVDRILNGNPAFLQDSTMLSMSPQPNEAPIAQQHPDRAALTAVYVSPELKTDKASIAGTAQTNSGPPVDADSMPTYKPVNAAASLASATDTPGNEPEIKMDAAPLRKSVHRDREIKTHSGRMRTIQ
ncbi:hypothetical protein [Chitinophaga sp. LS1]|uniref:hypothetical protein n=1 Tax=Chitinophaga sp. LS1 TaxID=3051176 RepID=UPI002AAB2ACD|nr:hypothetical protein [Chitinophaga sp. LS1]WPV67521.1 hypothetical protein QQL36_02120 [Chitinophaga sp. LS1]